MALFTDGPISNLEDLAAQDTQLLKVANVEGIDVRQKLILAQEEVAMEVMALMKEPGRTEYAVWLPAEPQIGNVVVTPALTLWHTFRTLEMVYGDAYASQLNDRYAAKRDQFHGRANWAYERLLLAGIGVAWSPIPRPGPPQVTSTPGMLADGTYYVATTFVNCRGEEGAPSLATSITTSGSALMVQPTTAPPIAAWWNVYVGADPNMPSRQNEAPIALAHAWVQPNPVETGGSAPGTGQQPNYLLPIPRRMLRG